MGVAGRRPLRQTRPLTAAGAGSRAATPVRDPGEARQVGELQQPRRAGRGPRRDRPCFPDGPPPILDPFAGGGAIPLEAQRLGLTALAGDLNPVAVLINKAMIEIPPRFAGTCRRYTPASTRDPHDMGPRPGAGRRCRGLWTAGCATKAKRPHRASVPRRHRPRRRDAHTHRLDLGPHRGITRSRAGPAMCRWSRSWTLSKKPGKPKVVDRADHRPAHAETIRYEIREGGEPRRTTGSCSGRQGQSAWRPDAAIPCLALSRPRSCAGQMNRYRHWLPSSPKIARGRRYLAVDSELSPHAPTSRSGIISGTMETGRSTPGRRKQGARVPCATPMA